MGNNIDTTPAGLGGDGRADEDDMVEVLYEQVRQREPEDAFDVTFPKRRTSTTETADLEIVTYTISSLDDFKCFRRDAILS